MPGGAFCRAVGVRMTLNIMSSGENPITILVADDHPVLREGVLAVLSGVPDMKVAAQAANGREALEKFRRHRPDIVLMDIQMPEVNGIDAIAMIRSEAPAARVIVLTTYRGDVSALRALRAGAVGYLLKSQLLNELVDTIRAVHAGMRRIPPEIAAELAAHFGDDALSEREIQVLRLVAQGNSNKRVAADLGVSEDTIKAHMKNVCSKLNAKDRTHAVTIALRRGILEL
jgi:DNA-binding NarL/FixJ family response regulator